MNCVCAFLFFFVPHFLFCRFHLSHMQRDPSVGVCGCARAAKCVCGQGQFRRVSGKNRWAR